MSCNCRLHSRVIVFYMVKFQEAVSRPSYSVNNSKQVTTLFTVTSDQASIFIVSVFQSFLFRQQHICFNDSPHMISPTTLYYLANMLGILAMITVLGYHAVVVNARYLEQPKA